MAETGGRCYGRLLRPWRWLWSGWEMVAVERMGEEEVAAAEPVPVAALIAVLIAVLQLYSLAERAQEEAVPVVPSVVRTREETT